MKKPKIRFKGYTEDWEQRKLSEIADKVTEKNKENKFDEPFTNSAEQGIISQKDYFDRDIVNEENLGNYYIVRNDDFVYNPRISVTAPVGPINRNRLGRNGVMSPLYTVFRTKDIEPLYLEYYFKTTSWHKFMKLNGDSGARFDRFTISSQTFMEMPIPYPCAEEQRKIGQYLDKLENLITLHQRKCEETKKLKKFMLQKMFPQNGSSVPEIRFSGFTEDWEQRKLGELTSEFQSGKFIAAADIEESGEYPVYGGNGLRGYTDRYNHDGVYALIGRQGALCGNVNKSSGKAYFTEHAVAVKANDDNDTDFLFHMLGRMNLGQYSDQSAQPGLAVGKLVALSAMVPKLDEQKKISGYFSSIDNLITLHQWKCSIKSNFTINVWEQRKLGQISDSYSGGTPTAGKKEYYDGNIPFIRSGEISSDKTELFITEEGLNSSSAKMVTEGDILYALYGATSGEVSISKLKGAINQAILAIQPNNGYDSQFIMQWLRKSKESIISTYLQGGQGNLSGNIVKELLIDLPTYDEQKQIGGYFEKIDNLITLHQCKPFVLNYEMDFVWEQRKLEDVVEFLDTQRKPLEGAKRVSGPYPYYGASGIVDYVDGYLFDEELVLLSEDGANITDRNYPVCFLAAGKYWVNNHAHVLKVRDGNENNFICNSLERKDYTKYNTGMAMPKLNQETCRSIPVMCPVFEEQKKIGEYFRRLDQLITLHQRKEKTAEKAFIYIEIQFLDAKETKIMAELEALIEQKLIDQLVYGDSQWTYRPDLRTEADLWKNFRYILEQNNKDRLNGESLSDTEFDQVKNQLQFSSFYKAGEWLVGENGKVMVHVQRDTERLHLVVMNHEHIAGGSSVYEVINQYQALDTDGNSTAPARDRRFDVTLMINGLPMIHIELKNKQHPYMDGFRQIKKYIGEGKFTGIFSAVQMFVVSNGVDTKYFAAASDRELNEKFLSGWVDNDNNPVTDYLDFAKSVLRIPEAHEMIARYTVLDEAAKRLIILRPYQIHAIEAIRDASKSGKSGFVWHTTGSGKTLTSYKATRNLLMDIPSLDKTIFLIDRKDLDTQTTQAFQAYANNDLIDVDETDNVFDLKNKLKSDDRQVIVTTIQKLQILITKRLQEGTAEYDKIKNRRIAFVVDECHRAVTPTTKRILERFFGKSLWYGFTGTPRFAENPYPQMGDLPRTTEELYGERLHRYTIQNAIHDNAVLGFQVEHNGPKNVADETDASIYDNETHMLSVLEIILNKSFNKLGFQNGKGKTYEGLLTVSSIQLAQKYYDLLTRVKNGETSLVIDEKIKQVLPDFPKFAITYSVSENAEGSQVNQQKMQKSLDDYNEMFGTKYDLSQIQGYNANLNKRLARKDHKYDSRNEQLDLVIVVDRLLTGFDAPCMSTIFIDRQPMGPHDLIQAFSRTNRIFDKNKVYGQIVTFQAPVAFKEAVDIAVKLYSAGGTKDALMAEWDEVEPAFRKSLSALRVAAESPADIPGLSKKEKKIFVKMFQEFDRLFSQLKSFTVYDDSLLSDYGITQEEYDDYAGHYKNVVEELRDDQPDPGTDDPDDIPIDPEYELMAYSNTKIDYEYIINLIQNIVTPENSDGEITPEERQKKIDEVKQYVEDLRKENPKVAEIMSDLIYDIELDDSKYRGQSIMNIIENTKEDCIDRVITDFCIIWYASKEEVMYAATHYRNGEIPNESAIKATIDFQSYKQAQEKALPKFKYYAKMMSELRKTLDDEIKPLLTH